MNFLLSLAQLSDAVSATTSKAASNAASTVAKATASSPAGGVKSNPVEAAQVMVIIFALAMLGILVGAFIMIIMTRRQQRKYEEEARQNRRLQEKINTSESKAPIDPPEGSPS